MERGYTRFAIAIISFVLLAVRASGAFAYNSDVHFNLTYVTCRLNGLAAGDSLWIAAADESMDENFSTTAFTSIRDIGEQELHLKPKVWVRNGMYWHAFTRVGASTGSINDGLRTIRYDDPVAARASIIQRRDRLWQIVRQALRLQKSATDRIRADIALGQFLHYDQDRYAHRQLTHYLNEERWLPYGPTRGHSADGHIPDLVSRRVDLAREMIRETDEYISHFCEQLKPKTRRMPHDGRVLDELVEALVQTTGLPEPEINGALKKVLEREGFARISSVGIPQLSPTDRLPYDNPNIGLRVVEVQLGLPAGELEKGSFVQVLMPDFLREAHI